jgi:hypothetical protein
MKSFFRLLFISFGLLLLLGISNSQYLDIHENPLETFALYSPDFFPGIIPDVLTEAGLPFLSSEWSLLPKGYCTSPAQKEFFTAKCIQTRLLFLELKYGEYSHKTLTKQGVQIHLQAPEDPLSLA